MLPIPDRIWIARRYYERWGGRELAEAIIYDEHSLDMYRAHGYEIKEFVAA